MKCISTLLLLTAAGLWFRQESDQDMVKPTTQAMFALEDLVAEAEQSGHSWIPFLDRPTLNCGVYRLPAGAKDPQGPHELDEVYYVVSGRARLSAGDEEFEAKPGSIFFVQAEIEHRFFDIEEDLVVVVFFSKKRERKKD